MKTKLFVIAFIFLATLALSLCMGPTFINPFALDDTTKEIIFNIRMPRAIVAALMGMALGASGAVLQGILRNPLADPYILGISSGASLTAALGLISGLTLFGSFTVPVLAFAGALITGGIVGAMGWKRGGLWPERL